MLLAQVVTADAEAMQSFMGTISSLFWIIVYILIAAVLYAIIYGVSALWKLVADVRAKVSAGLKRLDDATRPKPADPSADPVTPPKTPTRRADPTPQSSGPGIPSSVLLESLANDSAVMEATINVTYGDKKKYQLAYSVKEVAANG